MTWSPWGIRQRVPCESAGPSSPSAEPALRAPRRGPGGAAHNPLATLGVASGLLRVWLLGVQSPRASPPPPPHPVTRPQVAEAARRAGEGRGASLPGSRLAAPASSPPPARPRRPAPRSAPGAPLRPRPAPAPRSARLAAAAAAVASLSPSAADAPGPSGEGAPVLDPSPDTPGPVDSRVPLLHPASPKMNVRRVESISAQLEEASSTGGRMQ